MSGNKPPKLSVCVITYNHQNYIRQCLNSIIEQVVDCSFEIIVGDDCSTDGTRTIIEEFSTRYPDIFRLIYQEENTGGIRNYIAVHSAARGDYVAHVDGDDYLMQGKLQSQVDCLDSFPEVSFAAHAVSVEGTNRTIGDQEALPEFGGLSDLLRLGTYFVHSSTMYRRKYEPEQYEESRVLDFSLYVERLSNGKVYLDRRVLGCYREHDQSISKSVKLIERVSDYYEIAYDRAKELGADIDEVEEARYRRRKHAAITLFLAGYTQRYKDMIYIPCGDMRHAGSVHALLSLTRYLPVLIWGFYKVRMIKVALSRDLMKNLICLR